MFCSDVTSRATPLPPAIHVISGQALQGADLIIALLKGIARESAAIGRIRHARSGPWSAERPIDRAIETSLQTDACTLLTWQIAGLLRIVARFDRDIAGTEAGSLAELGLRAQTLAVLLSLDEICEAVKRGSLDLRDLAIGRFGAIDDVVWFVFDALAAINKQWLQSRPLSSGPVPFGPRGGSSHATTLYRAGIEQAQRDLAALRTDPDLTAFLRAGACTAVSLVRHACARILDSLAIALTCEVDPAIWLLATLDDGPTAARCDDLAPTPTAAPRTGYRVAAFVTVPSAG